MQTPLEFKIDQLETQLRKAQAFHEYSTCVGTLAWRHIELARVHRSLAEKTAGELSKRHKSADRYNIGVASALAKSKRPEQVAENVKTALQKSEELLKEHRK